MQCVNSVGHTGRFSLQHIFRCCCCCCKGRKRSRRETVVPGYILVEIYPFNSCRNSKFGNWFAILIASRTLLLFKRSSVKGSYLVLCCVVGRELIIGFEELVWVLISTALRGWYSRCIYLIGNSCMDWLPNKESVFSFLVSKAPGVEQ